LDSSLYAVVSVRPRTAVFALSKNKKKTVTASHGSAEDQKEDRDESAAVRSAYIDPVRTENRKPRSSYRIQLDS